MRWEFDPFAVLYQVFAWGDPALECYQMTFQFTTLCANSFSQSRGQIFCMMTHDSCKLCAQWGGRCY